MSSIPQDIYERVHELADAIVKASEAGDDARREVQCLALRAYFDEQFRAGRSYPFLTEALQRTAPTRSGCNPRHP